MGPCFSPLFPLSVAVVGFCQSMLIGGTFMRQLQQQNQVGTPFLPRVPLPVAVVSLLIAHAVW